MYRPEQAVTTKEHAINDRITIKKAIKTELARQRNDQMTGYDNMKAKVSYYNLQVFWAL